jgi:hypothetical protein
MKVGDLVKYEWTQEVDGGYHTFVSVGVVLETWMRLYIETVWIEWCDGAEAQWVDCDDLEVIT